MNINKKLRFKYLNENNYLIYSITNNACVFKSMIIELNLNYNNIVEFYNEMIKEVLEKYPSIDQAICFPGTYNPLLVKAHLENIDYYKFSYKIFYNKEEIIDNENFIKKLDSYYVNTLFCNGGPKDFKLCCISHSLKSNITVKPPIKYYKIDENNYLVEEYDENPNIESVYQSVYLTQLFKEYNIRLENNKLKFYCKN